MIDTIAIIGAGSGGKAAAVDMALQGKKIRLFEFPEFADNIGGLAGNGTLTATGAVSGEATLELATTDLAAAMEGADTVMVCTQALAHDRAARELAPYLTPSHLVILNPGSTGGSLLFAQIFRSLGMDPLPTLIETSTLTYGCRAKGGRVEVPVKVNRVLYGALPSGGLEKVGAGLEALYPGFRRAATVLEAGLNNANPVIHPPIVILNAAVIENEGPQKYFYRDGVSPTVADLIRKLDNERMALLRALDYPAQPDPVTSVEQGYAASTDYYECYKNGAGYGNFRFPDTLDNRYFHEDIGMSLVLFCSLGKLLGVATPTCETIVRVGEALSGKNYMTAGKRTAKALGIAGMDKQMLGTYLQTGKRNF
jgi:opine dehydrogenase